MSVKNKSTKGKNPFKSADIIASYKSKITELDDKISHIKSSNIPASSNSECSIELANLIESILHHGHYLKELMGKRQNVDSHILDEQNNLHSQILRLQKTGTRVLESLESLSKSSDHSFSKLNDENKSLSVALQDSQRSNKGLYGQISDLKSKLEVVINERENIQRDAIEYHTKLEEKTRELNKFKIRCKSLEAQFSSAKSSKTSLHRKLSQKDSLIVELETEIARLRDRDKKSVNSREMNCLMLENERLKQALESNINRMKDDQRRSQSLIGDLRTKEEQLREYEKMIEHQKMSNDEIIRNEMDKQSGEAELMRTAVLSKLDELEHIPELLKSTELQLIEARRRAEESDNKARLYNNQLEVMREQLNMEFYPKMDQLEKKMTSMEEEKEKLRQRLLERENDFKELMAQLETKRRENENLTRQLEEALLELRKGNSSVGSEKLSQLSQHIQKLKEQVQALQTRRDQEASSSSSKVAELEMQLERSDSLNQSLQKYVNFLKDTLEGKYNSDPEFSMSVSPQKYSSMPATRTL